MHGKQPHAAIIPQHCANAIVNVVNQAGAFKIGDTAGTLDNIIACKLHRPGSVGFVSKSGGMSNEMYNVLARATDGLFEGACLLCAFLLTCVHLHAFASSSRACCRFACTRIEMCSLHAAPICMGTRAINGARD